MKREDCLQWIDTQAGRMQALLAEWAAINTHTDNIPGLTVFADALMATFVELGTVGRVKLRPREIVDDDGRVIDCEVGEVVHCRPTRPAIFGQRRVLLGIHYDTVYPVGTGLSQASVEGEVLRGPGVADAKGGIIVMLLALQALEKSAERRGIAWEVLLNPDEEVGSPSSGGMFLEAAGRNDLGLLFEPALPGGMLASSRKGSGNWTAVLRGRAAHAGRDFYHGRNAVCAAADLIGGLEALRVEGATANVGQVRGGGAVNVVPNLALCRWNVRVENLEQAGAIQDQVAAVLERVQKRDGISLELHGGFHCPPKLLDSKTLGLLEALRQCGDELGIPIQWKPTGGACDGNKLAAAGLTVVDNLGVCGGEIHSEREYCELPSLVERAKLVALLLMKIGAGEAGFATTMEERT